MQHKREADARRMIESTTPYFTPEEFACRCCGKFYMDDDLVFQLNHLREKFDDSIILTSAYRCLKHNKEIGGKPNSFHCLGMAVDVKISNLSSSALHSLISIALDRSNGLCFLGFGMGAGKLHLDVRKFPGSWTYP